MIKNNLDDFKERLSHIIPVDNLDINKLHEEILSFFSESKIDYIKRRHKELQSQGYKNTNIYTIISTEIPNRLFRGQKLSARQLKRIIYND
jgi:hypothetical protein